MDANLPLDLIVGAVVYIAPFLFVLTVVVFFHELGHFLVARWTGVDVRVFSVGFGPSLVGFTDRKGTRWQISAIPLGGYVRFLGDENAASAPDREALRRMPGEERQRSFASQPVGVRAAIVAAGPIANFLLAVVIFATIFATMGRDVVLPKVDAVVPGSAAEEAGFVTGDIVRAIDGRSIATFQDLQRIVGIRGGEELTVTVERDGAERTLVATPRREEITDRFGNTMTVGILGISRDLSGDAVITERPGVAESIWLGVSESWFVIEHTVTYLHRVIIGRESAEQLGGPIGIAQLSSDAATLGFLQLIKLAALISVNIGFINLFPIPLLDGGHLVFFAAEAIRGRPLSERVQEIGFRLGFAVIGMLMIFTVWNDIVR